jgi:hypothetical protein
MASNRFEIPGLVVFANERNMRVFFNTVVFPADHSIKALPVTAQREILELYTSSGTEPRTAVESANREAMVDFCRQIEFWMGEVVRVAMSPLEARCAELLADHREADSLAAVLSDLAGNNVGKGTRQVVHIEGADPVQELKGYIEAMWEVGAMLQSRGLHSDLRFDNDKLQAYLGYLDRSVAPDQASRIYLEMRRFPKEMLRFSGMLSAAQLIELLEAHLLAGVRTLGVVGPEIEGKLRGMGQIGEPPCKPPLP